MNFKIAGGFTADETNTARRSGCLLSMELKLSRACNLHCISCYGDSGPALEEELTLAKILDYFDQAVELGAKRIICRNR